MPEAASGRLRILAHHHNARRLLPGALLPGQRTRTRHPRHRRHPRRPRRQTLAPRTPNRLTSRTHTREWTRLDAEGADLVYTAGSPLICPGRVGLLTVAVPLPPCD